MSSFKLKVITPTQVVFEGEVESVTASTIDGSIGILAGHIELFTILAAGDVKYESKGSKESIYLDGGILEVSPEQVLIVA